MSFTKIQINKWLPTMLKKFQHAKESKDSEFKIIQVEEDKFDNFYILFTIKGGHYKGQTHILMFNTNNGKDILFPYTHPSVKFITKIWHPNISVTGLICLDIFKEKNKWSPQYGIGTVISSIILLLDQPDNTSAFNSDAAIMFNNCEKEYETLKNKTDQKINNEIYDKCFKIFDDKAKSYANIDISNYLEMFKNV